MRRVPGAFFNGVFLLALALSIFLQSIERFVHIEPVESPVMVLIVGAVGLTLNITSMIVVHGVVICQYHDFTLHFVHRSWRTWSRRWCYRIVYKGNDWCDAAKLWYRQDLLPLRGIEYSWLFHHSMLLTITALTLRLKHPSITWI